MEYRLLKCHVISHWPRDQRLMGLQEWESLTVSQHPTKFGVVDDRVSGDMMGLICDVPFDHVVSEYHVAKGSSNSMSRSPFR